MVAHSKEVWFEKEVQQLVSKFNSIQRNFESRVSTHKWKLISLASLCTFVCYRLYQKYVGGDQSRLQKITKNQTNPSNGEDPSPTTQQRHRTRIDREFLDRLLYLVRIAMPHWFSKEMVICICTGITVIAQSFLINLSNSIAGDLMVDLTSRNQRPFFKHLLMLTGVLTCNSVVSPFIHYLIGNLHVSMRKNMTLHIHKLYYRNMIYYKAQNLDRRLGNPDQRITQDVDVVCKQITSLFLDLLSPAIDVILYTYQLNHLMGVGGPLSILIYMAIAFFALSFVTPNFTRMAAETQNREGEFRHIHARARLNAESIAFYGGDEKERTIIERYFKNLTDYSMVVIRKNFIFGVVNDYFTKYAPYAIMSLVAGIPFFYGEKRKLSSQEVMGSMRYLVAVIAYEFFAVGKLIELFRKLLKLSGYTNRVHLLFEVMNDLEQREKKKSEKINGEIKNSEEIRFENVSIYTPHEVLLAKQLSFVVKKGKNVVISGPNGAGKSSLFRVLGGLWPLYEGTVYKPGTGKDGLSKEIFYLPQKPYNVIGSLRDQIVYPDTRSRSTDKELRRLLDMFGIRYLSTRHNEGFDGCQDWDKLSRGEQQRLAMVRLFYHKPSYAILDECTSCINKDAETDLYNNCAKNGITCITISHRPALEKFHQYKLWFDGEGGWSFEKKSKSGKWTKQDSFSIERFSKFKHDPLQKSKH